MLNPLRYEPNHFQEFAHIGAQANKKKHAPANERDRAADKGPVTEVGRNTLLTSEAGNMRRIGMSQDEILAALRIRNAALFGPSPLDEDEVEHIAASVSRYEPAPVADRNGHSTFDTGTEPKLSKRLQEWIEDNNIPDEYDGDPMTPLCVELLESGFSKDKIFELITDDDNEISSWTKGITDKEQRGQFGEAYAEALASVLPVIYSAAEIEAASFPKPDPLIDGMMKEGETILFIGRAKTRKSAVALQGSIDLASRSSFLGHVCMRHGKVLYLDLENKGGELQERLQEFGKNVPGDWRDRIHFYAPETLADNVFTFTPKGFARMRLAVQKYQPDLVILDSLRLFLGHNDPNDGQTAVSILKKVSTLRQINPRLSIMIIHHLRKFDPKGSLVNLQTEPEIWIESASGSQAWIAHVDSIWGLEVDRGDGGEIEAAVLALVRRHGPTKILHVMPEIDDDGGGADKIRRFQLMTHVDYQAALNRIFATERQVEIWENLPEVFDWEALLKAANESKAIASRVRGGAIANGLVTVEPVLRKKGKDGVKYRKVYPGTPEHRNHDEENDPNLFD